MCSGLNRTRMTLYRDPARRTCRDRLPRAPPLHRVRGAWSGQRYRGLTGMVTFGDGYTCWCLRAQSQHMQGQHATNNKHHGLRTHPNEDPWWVISAISGVRHPRGPHFLTPATFWFSGEPATPQRPPPPDPLRGGRRHSLRGQNGQRSGGVPEARTPGTQLLSAMGTGAQPGTLHGV